jgi:hypothetical protein
MGVGVWQELRKLLLVYMLYAGQARPGERAWLGTGTKNGKKSFQISSLFGWLMAGAGLF